jgi:beta-galactosidase beta subunit
VIEALPASEKHAADSGYSKRKLWIRKDNHYTVKKEYYDKNNQALKVETHRKLVNVKGAVWRADEIEMADVQGGTKTITLIEKRAVDKGLKDSMFTEAELTRGGS